MQDTNRPLPPADDEVNLIDLWRVLAKRKALVLGAPVMLLLAAAVYLLTAKPVFGSRAVIQVGQVGQVEAPAVLVQRLREQYRVSDKDATTVMPKVTDIGLDKKGSDNVIIFLVQDYSAEGAQKYLTHVAQALLAEHTKLYSQSMDVQRQRLQSLDKQVLALNDHLEKLSVHIDAMGKQNPAQATVLAIEKGKLLAEAPGLEREYTTLRLALSDIQSQPTKLLREPTLPHSQTKPKRTQILALAAMLGLMLGIAVVFIAEFWGKARQRLCERAV